MKKNRITKTLLFNICIFLIMVLFFTKICPVIPFDGDDWYFNGSIRLPFPMWRIFNPIKVLPEVLEPIGGYIGAYIVYPITNDYIGAISTTQAIIISLFIVMLFYNFYDFVRNKYNKSEIESILFEAIFAMFFFFIFKKSGGKSYYGFWATDLNCYFNYIIPGALNATIILIMAKYNDFIDEFKSWNYYKKGIFLVGIYFSIFSSIQLSIILSGYCSWIILRNLYKIFKRRENKKIIQIIQETGLVYFIIEFLWLISLLFAQSGKRAAGISRESWITKQNIFNVAKNFLSLYKQTNKIFLVIILILIVMLLIQMIRNNTKKKNITILFIETVYIFIITFAYLFILYMKAGANYANRPDATWAIIFYIVLYSNIYLIVVLDHIVQLKVIIPLTITLLCIMTVNMNYRFEQSVFDYKTAKKINETIINQIVEADKAGNNYVEVQVPDYKNNKSNWPQPYNMAIWMQNTLYSHNIITKRMKIVFVKNAQMYDKLYNANETSNESYYDFERGTYIKE